MITRLIRLIARLYWEVLTGRRKLPGSAIRAHRRRTLKLMAVIFLVSVALWTALYFAGTDAIRSRALATVVPAFGTFFIGLLILIAMYRRRPIRKEDGNSVTGTQSFADIREYWGYPPKQDQVIEQVFSGDQVGGDWDYAIHIHEGAEQYLGLEQFRGLQKRFASVSGVDECKHEDREVFLIRTRTLNAETLRESCWKQFIEAAKLAFEKEDRR